MGSRGGAVCSTGVNKVLSSVTPFDITTRVTSDSQSPTPEVAIRLSPKLTAEISYRTRTPSPLRKSGSHAAHAGLALPAQLVDRDDGRVADVGSRPHLAVPVLTLINVRAAGARCTPGAARPRFCSLSCDSNIAESVEIDDPGLHAVLSTDQAGGPPCRCRKPTRSSTPPISHGTVINDRYEIRQSLGKGGMGEVFLAYDRSTQQPVALKIVREEARMPGDDEALRQELLARALGQPPERLPRARSRAEPVRPDPRDGAHRRADAPHAHPSAEGPGRLHTGRVSQDRERGLRRARGDPRPGSRPRRSEARQRHGDRRQRHHPRLRLRSGARARVGAASRRTARRRHAELHVARAPPLRRREPRRRRLRARPHALGDVDVPRPRARLQAAREADAPQIMFDVPAGSSIDEVKQIFRCLSDDAAMRPHRAPPALLQPDARSRRARCRSRASGSTRARRSGARRRSTFAPGAQSLLVTYATNAPEIVGQLFPLDAADDQLGRRGDQDIVVPEATVSGAHAILRWQAGSWMIEDRGSTNGTYAEHSYERKTQVALMHGGEVQLGELRLKLVSFLPESPHHQRARLPREARRPHGPLVAQLPAAEPRRRGGVRGVGRGAAHRRALRDPRSEPPRIGSPDDSRDARAPPRRTARGRAHGNAALVALPVIAGRTGPLRFAVAMIGPTLEEARHVVEQVVAQVPGMLPESIELGVTIVKAEPKRPGRTLID